MGKWPIPCVEIVDGLWVTPLLPAKYAGQMRFWLCIKVFFNISIVEIFQRSFSSFFSEHLSNVFIELLIEEIQSNSRSFFKSSREIQTFADVKEYLQETLHSH